MRMCLKSGIHGLSLARAAFAFAAVAATTLLAQVDDTRNGRGFVRWEIDGENLHAPDINLLSASLSGVAQTDRFQWDIAVTEARLDVDYQPFAPADINGRPRDLDEQSTSARVQASLAPTPFSEYWVAVGGYHGFTNHSSLWLDEYYRQQFSQFEGYVPASPWGFSVSAGFSRDFGRVLGVLGANVAFSQDDVAPGYDRPLFQELERGRERLYTSSFVLSLESVPTERIRLRHEVSLSDVSDRDLRFSYRGNLNVALGESWVARAQGAYTVESARGDGQQDFHAGSVSLTLEHDWNQTWFLSAQARGYRDNGQIETSILVSAGPPPLDTTEFGLSLRHQGERWAWKLGAASYRTRYDEVASPIRPFGNLYRDRDWVLIDTTISYSF